MGSFEVKGKGKAKLIIRMKNGRGGALLRVVDRAEQRAIGFDGPASHAMAGR